MGLKKPEEGGLEVNWKNASLENSTKLTTVEKIICVNSVKAAGFSE